MTLAGELTRATHIHLAGQVYGPHNRATWAAASWNPHPGTESEQKGHPQYPRGPGRENAVATGAWVLGRGCPWLSAAEAPLSPARASAPRGLLGFSGEGPKFTVTEI